MKKGFTLLELSIVIIIVGILATLAIVQYKAYRETTLDREAQANLKLIYDAELIHKLESSNNTYIAPTTNTNAGLNSALKLQLQTSNSNWNYTITTCSSSTRFTAQASRAVGSARYWCLNSLSSSTTGDPSPTGGSTTACSCP